LPARQAANILTTLAIDDCNEVTAMPIYKESSYKESSYKETSHKESSPTESNNEMPKLRFQSLRDLTASQVAAIRSIPAHDKVEFPAIAAHRPTS
jgi:hypothetical protein